MFVSETFLSTAGMYSGFLGLLICLTLDLCLLELKFRLVLEAGCGKNSSEVSLASADAAVSPHDSPNQ